VRFLVWRFGDKAPRDVRLIEASGHDLAAAFAHEADSELADKEVFFVQPVEGARKVRVVSSERVMEPSFYTNVVADKSALIARCEGCNRRSLEVGYLVAGQCSSCGRRVWARKGACA
jgi:hypothetical protein